jgi:hypothetical protein
MTAISSNSDTITPTNCSFYFEVVCTTKELVAGPISESLLILLVQKLAIFRRRGIFGGVRVSALDPLFKGGLNKSDTSIWNKFECVPNGIKSTTFVNRNWFDTPIWNKFVTFVCYLE